MKHYRLKKDLPTFKAGETFVLWPSGLFRDFSDLAYSRETLDKFPNILEEWFEELKLPAEPLIKNKEIRKAIRAWAEACNLKHVTYKQASNEFYDSDTRGAFAIRFTLIPVEVYLEDGECYTIAELCGEEEECVN